MSLLRPCPSPSPSPFPSLQSTNHSAISTPFLSKILISLTIARSPKIFSASSAVSPNNRWPSIQSSTNSSSSSQTGVFIKGMAQSVAEGRLKKAFSEFGEIEKVKIVVEKKSKQPLGSGFVWFRSEESAKLAVKEMNGKFFDGRFILVKIAEEAKSWNNKGRMRRRYKF